MYIFRDIITIYLIISFTISIVGSRIFDKVDSVFVYNNVSFNCLGIPSQIVALKLESFFFDSTKAENVQFYFFSRSQPDPKLINKNFREISLKELNFNISRQTVLIVHGFLSHGKIDWIKQMKDAFLNHKDMNVVIVDWKNGSNTWNYLEAATSTKIVGQQISNLFEKIKHSALGDLKTPKKIIDWGDIHFIGHSLGAHICAHASYLIKKNQMDKNVWTVSRITGLDPAQPCFGTADKIFKLDKNDAPYVEIIHTNARYLLYLGLGLPDQSGFIDVFPNGGKTQPGCSDLNVTLWSFFSSPIKMAEVSQCSHGRSHELYTDSINNYANENCSYFCKRWNRLYKNINQLLDQNCNHKSCPIMGLKSFELFPLNKGIFFVPTSNTTPYCNLNDYDKRTVMKLIQSDVKMENNILKRWTNYFKNIMG